MNVPDGWISTTLGAECEVFSGATPKTGIPAYWGGSVPWITPKDMAHSQSQVMHNGARMLTKEGLDSSSARLFPAGSVIVSSRAPIGYVCIAGCRMATNQGCKTATPSERLDSRYLYWFLINAKSDLEKRASGTTFKEISTLRFKETRLWFPDLHEQRRIVEMVEEHLAHLDAADAALSRSATRAQSMLKASLRLVVENAESTGTPLTIGDLADVGTGTTPAKSNAAYYESGTIPWVTSGDLSQGVVTTTSTRVTKQALQETSLREYPPGTLLMAMYGEGKTRGTVAELGIDATTNQACAAIQLHSPELRPWVRICLTSQYDSMRRISAGGVQPNLNLGMVRKIKIPVPDKSFRDTLTTQYQDLRNQALTLEKEVAKSQTQTKALRRAVLAAAFSGRLTSQTNPERLIEELQR